MVMHQWMLTSNSIQLTVYTDRRFIKVALEGYDLDLDQYELKIYAKRL